MKERTTTTHGTTGATCLGHISSRVMRSPSTSRMEDFSSALFLHGRSGLCPLTLPVEGLRMDREPLFEHVAVMADQVVDLLAPVPTGILVDATVGGGGHAAALLAARPDQRLLGLDRDPDAIAAAARRLEPFGDRTVLRRAPFGSLGAVLSDLPPGWQEAPIAGVLLDLGVSSPQLDRPERGFSLRLAGALDMRMDPTAGRSAAEVVNTASTEELAALFAASGENRLARRLARAVVAARPLTTTTELADVIAAAVPAALRRRGHPATRVFQALRIEVNDELDQLAAILPEALDRLAPGGRMVTIAYHSGEDRLVKAAFAEAVTGGCTCPPGLPCVCGADPRHRLVFRGSHQPGAEELARNPRASSARLRAIERLDEPEVAA